MSNQRKLFHPFALALLAMAIGLAFPIPSSAQEEFHSGLRDASSVKEPGPRERVEQVDLHSGNLMVRHTDLQWKGNGGLDLVVTRHYDLQNASAGLQRAYNSSFRWAALGPGWTMMVAPRWVERKYRDTTGWNTPIVTDLTRLCNGTIRHNSVPSTAPALELPDGRKEVLIFVSPGRAVSRGNWQATCSANRITVNSPDGTTYDMGDIGTVWTGQDGTPVIVGLTFVLPAIKATDPQGNYLEFQYRKVGASSPLSGLNPSAIQASDGRAVTFTYDETSRKLLSMQDNADRSWSYAHDGTGIGTSMLVSATLPGDQTWRYSYHPGVVVSREEANAVSTKLQTLTYPEGGSISFEVEPFWAKTWKFGEEVKGERIKRRTLSTGESWSYGYTRGTAGQYDTTVERGPGGVFSYKFMGFGHTVASASTSFSDTLWRISSLIEKTDAHGNRESYVYTPREIYDSEIGQTGPELVRDRKIWAPDLAQRTIVRDSATYTTKFSNFDGYGNAGTVAETGPSGETRTTTRTFHNDTARWIIGQLEEETSAGVSTAQTFDTFGNVLSLDKNGIVTNHTYDSQGNISTTTFPRGLVHTYSNYKRGVAQNEAQPEGVLISRIVDDEGNITSETNGEGRTTLYGHDAAGRVTSIAYPAGKLITVSYSPNSKVLTRGGLTEETTYDGFGRAASVSLGGIAHTYRYDALSRKTFASDAGSATGTTYQYDTLNRVTLATRADNTSERTVYSGVTKTVYDERNHATAYTYRAYGEPGEQHLMSITAPEVGASVAIARDARNLITSVTQGGLTRDYAYNASHQLISVTNPETGITTYGRDAANNMTSRSVGTSGTTTYAYDGQNRLTNAVYPGATPSVTKAYSKTHKLKEVTSSAASHTYAYDTNDNLHSETIAVDGHAFVTGYGYNDIDQLASITYPVSGRVVDFAPDVLGRPTKAGSFVNSVAYWPSGMFKQIAYGNGTVTSYEQHPRLWPSSFVTQRGSTAFMNSKYTYDGVGNLTSIADSVDSSHSRTMAFDKINRLTSISGPWGNGSIAYNGTGNITSQVLGGEGLYYNYDGANRLVSVSGSRGTTFSYDAHGNVTAGSGRTFSYDGAPNLRCANCANGPLKTEYTYDGLNQRVAVRKSGTTTYEIYGSHGNQLLAYTPGSPSKLVEYIYLGSKRIAQRVGF